MKSYLKLLTVAYVAVSSVNAQAPAFQDTLLDRLIGHWVLRGQIAGQNTTHDIHSEWVLGHQYVRLLEVSREKNSKGQPAYEAIVLIGWDQSAGEYQCLWLDSTGGGGLTGQAIAHAKRSGEQIPFIFTERDGGISFINTFAYDKSTDSWTWVMDNVQKGKNIPFARVKLTKQ